MEPGSGPVSHFLSIHFGKIVPQPLAQPDRQPRLLFISEPLARVNLRQIQAFQALPSPGFRQGDGSGEFRKCSSIMRVGFAWLVAAYREHWRALRARQ